MICKRFLFLFRKGGHGRRTSISTNDAFYISTNLCWHLHGVSRCVYHLGHIRAFLWPRSMDALLSGLRVRHVPSVLLDVRKNNEEGFETRETELTLALRGELLESRNILAQNNSCDAGITQKNGAQYHLCKKQKKSQVLV